MSHQTYSSHKRTTEGVNLSTWNTCVQWRIATKNSTYSGLGTLEVFSFAGNGHNLKFYRQINENRQIDPISVQISVRKLKFACKKSKQITDYKEENVLEEKAARVTLWIWDLCNTLLLNSLNKINNLISVGFF